MNIVILSRNPRLYSTKRLVEAATKRKHSVQVIDPLMCEIIIEKKNFFYIMPIKNIILQFEIF